MKTPMLLKQLAVGVGLSTVLVGTAIAAPVVSFDFTQEFEWVEPISPAGVDKDPLDITSGIDDVDGYTKLSWGTGTAAGGGNQSSLVINPEAGDSQTPSGDLSSGTINVSPDVDNVSFGLGPVVVHNNFVITGTSLDETQAEDNVILTPNLGSALPARNIVFGVNFQETNNSLLDPADPANAGADPGDLCPEGVAYNSFGCGDIFALSGGLLGVETILNGSIPGFLIDSFLLGEYIYDVYITALGMGVLSDTACAAVGSASGCIGFTTFENQVNAFALAFGIVAREAPIPEPATLALLAGSLLLMGVVRRRKVTLSA